MLALKLFLVPACLALISLAGKRWGPEIAGWLAGFPVLTGPILFLIALENGAAFAAAAGTVSLSAVFGAVAFSLTYSRAATRASPLRSLLAGLGVWCCAALLLTHLPLTIYFSLAIALATLLVAPKLFPRVSAPITNTIMPRYELPLRMLAGAVVTIAVTSLAAAIGPAWSGMFAVFPVLSIVLAVFLHRASGAAFATTLLKSMIWGLYAFTSFCFTVAMLLPRLGVAVAFACAVGVAVVVQGTLKSRLKRR